MSDTNAAPAAGDEVVLDGQEIETRARRLGWVAQEEFRGEPSRWKPADEFLKRGEDVLPIMRENNRKLQDQLDRMTSEMAEVRNATVELREFSSKAEERAYKRAKEELDREMRAAFQTGDAAAFDDARRRMDGLETPKPAETARATPSTPQLDPRVKQWIDSNEWFNRDKTMNSFATAYHGTLLADKPGMTMEENLAEVAAEVKRRFPEKFSNARRDAPNAVGSPGAPNGMGGPAKRSYENLPPEARAACDRFMKTIPGYKKEDYVKAYQWD